MRRHFRALPVSVLALAAAVPLMLLGCSQRGGMEDDPTAAAATHELLRANGGNKSGCNICSIDPRGHVHYDQFSWHYDCGDVRRQSFAEIWSAQHDARLSMLRDRRGHLPGKCQRCRFLDVCNGNLRTRAEAATPNLAETRLQDTAHTRAYYASARF